MKNKIIIGITVMILFFAVVLLISNNRKGSDTSVAQDSIAEENEMNADREAADLKLDGTLSVINEEENAEKKQGKMEETEAKETDLEISGEDLKDQTESFGAETEKKNADLLQQSTANSETEEQIGSSKTAESEDRRIEMNPGSRGNGDTEETESRSETLGGSANGIYGDSGEKMSYPCDDRYGCAIVEWLSNPEWYEYEGSKDFYDQVFALSDRYRKEHPFSEGSILKPYYPDIDETYGFTGSFKERYVVLKAYDTSNVKKYFLIEFTVTDDEKLDTVSIRELADDEVGE